MVAPTTSYPASTRSAAATDESTPPDMATSTRAFTVPPTPNAERGSRNAEQSETVRSRKLATRRDPRAVCSAFRVPRSDLASPVQHRAQLPDLFDDLRQRPDHRLHVLQRVLLAEGEAQRRDAQLARHAHRREHVGRLDRPGAAGGPRGARDPGEVE